MLSIYDFNNNLIEREFIFGCGNDLIFGYEINGYSICICGDFTSNTFSLFIDDEPQDTNSLSDIIAVLTFYNVILRVD